MWYPQIEKECLSIVYDLGQFDQYMCGRTVIAENDHKPLNTLIKNRNYLVMVDYQSNFFEADFLPSTNSTIITKLRAHMACYGIPETLMSDNAQFSCAEFRKFTAEYGINDVTSSLGHSQSNGKTEAAVKAAKTVIKKMPTGQ